MPPRDAVDRSRGEGGVVRGDASTRPLALGTGRGRVGLGVGVGVGVLLEHPSGEVATQLACPFFALLECDQLVLMFGGEHQVKGRRRLREEALAQFFAARFGIGRSGRHDRDSTGTDGGLPAVTGILFPTRGATTQLHSEFRQDDCDLPAVSPYGEVSCATSP